MHPIRLIRIADIRYDYLTERLEGTAIRRTASGALLRERLSVPGDPDWTHNRSIRELSQQIPA